MTWTPPLPSFCASLCGAFAVIVLRRSKLLRFAFQGSLKSLGRLFGRPWVPWGVPGVTSGCHWGSLGASLGCLWALGWPPVRLLGAIGDPRVPLGGPRSAVGRLCGSLGALWCSLGCLSGRVVGFPGASWACLGARWAPLCLDCCSCPRPPWNPTSFLIKFVSFR